MWKVQQHANRTSRNKNKWNNSMYIVVWNYTSASCFLKFIYIQMWKMQQTRQYGTIHICICWRVEPVPCCLSLISDSIPFHLKLQLLNIQLQWQYVSALLYIVNFNNP
jgi:hypothetical protein